MHSHCRCQCRNRRRRACWRCRRRWGSGCCRRRRRSRQFASARWWSTREPENGNVYIDSLQTDGDSLSIVYLLSIYCLSIVYLISIYFINSCKLVFVEVKTQFHLFKYKKAKIRRRKYFLQLAFLGLAAFAALVRWP